MLTRQAGQRVVCHQCSCPSPVPVGPRQEQFWLVAPARSLDWDVLEGAVEGGQLRSFTERRS